MSSPRLLDQVRDRIRVKHYSLRMEDPYLHWIRRFIFFHGKKRPRDMGAQVEAFLGPAIVGDNGRTNACASVSHHHHVGLVIPLRG